MKKMRYYIFRNLSLIKN